MKQNMIRNVMLVLLGAMLILASGCVDDSSPEDVIDEEMMDEVYDEEAMGDMAEDADSAEGTMEESDLIVDPTDFEYGAQNSYFPLVPGTTFVLEGESDGEDIRVEMYITGQTKEILGVTTTVVREREWEDGELVEDTFDWYANDNEGNVWYFGEDSKEYDDGNIVSTAGSWESGIDGARPGILMKADPQVGDKYQQEYYEGEAEDMAEVLSLDASVTVEYGSFDDCLQTKEWTPLEPGVEENKFYASGVGLLLEEAVTEGDERLELVEITTE